MFKIAVLASGEGSNLQALIDYVHRPGEAQIVVVVSDNPGAYALARAKAADIPAVALAAGAGEGREVYHRRLADCLKPHCPALVVLAGYMRLLPPAFLKQFPKVLNVHPSLLPAFPGLEAPRQALKHGAQVSGCTVHWVDTGLDTGPIVRQEAVSINAGDTPETLHARIKPVEHRLLVQAVKMAVQGGNKNYGK